MKEKRARELFAEEVQEEKANKGWKYIRNLFEASIDSLVTIGPDGIIIDVNLATEKATGLPREKIIGTDFSEYFTDPDKARVGYKQVFDIGKVIDYELCLKHVNGSSIPVLYNASVYKDNEGQIIGVLAAARDISALKKYADELTDFRNNLELIVQQKTAELVTANEELAFQNEEKEKRAEELVIANEKLLYQNEEKEKRAAELVIANEKLLYQNEEKEKRAAELVIANEELLFQNEEKEKRAAELILANEELILQNEEKEKRAAELVLANRELAFQTGEKADRAAELIIANAELIHQNKEKDKRAAELIIANKELLLQNEEKEKRAAELILANKELVFQTGEKADRAAELVIADKELAFQTGEKADRAAELVIANRELIHQNEEKDKRAAELIIANEELLFQNEEKEKRAAELIIADKELAFQSEEKADRAAELEIADKELAFQTGEKADRAAELIIANAELIHQNKEKDKRAAELIIANKELLFQNEEKEKRAAELIIANKELLFQNREKEKRAAELVIANEELAFQNEEKEKRAAELVIANKELESFSYSVSHDLRTPLRHVVGFVVLLNEHMQETLDDQNRHYLEVISKAANDMGQLIDDLLSFSRIGKTVMESRKVDLNLLIKQVIETFEPGMDRRSIEWDIGTLPNVNGDTEMLKLVMSNLISNALKFTSLKTSARIEIGSKPDPENKSQVVFYIKDNGAGFDMQYKEKLFGVFQRLHSQKDFQGTGIGLANVKRVIQRHGGRVWAEGVLEEGAIFYFTLPKYEEES